MAEPTLASNNPFRRKGTGPTPTSGQSSDRTATDFLPPPFPTSDLDSSSSPSHSQTPSPFDIASSSFPAQPSGSEYREQLRALPKSSEAAPSTSFVNPKPIKRVRVQSPPPSPSSSEDEDAAEFEARFPAAGPSDRREESDFSDDEHEGGQKSFITPKAIGSLPMVAEPEDMNLGAQTRAPPPNPFQKTLKDLETEPADAEGDSASRPAAVPSPASKGSLDVSSFGRLLLTGQARNAGAAPGVHSTSQALSPGSQAPPAAVSAVMGDAASLTDASSISRHSMLDPGQPSQDTPRTSHEISETEEERSSLMHMATPSKRMSLRKKPPPPSSRHGKLIKAPPKDEAREDRKVEQTLPSMPAPNPAIAVPTSKYATTGPVETPSSPTDLNKPLPAPPGGRSPADENESIFDREAAGKIPEVDIDPDAPDEDIPPPRPPTPPNASHSTTTPSSNPRKPAPPPRRQPHGRAESKANNAPAHTAADDDLTPPRSSLDSTRSRSSSLRVSIAAPAPPPPRRPNHASRPSTSSFAPPSALSPGAAGITSPSSAGGLSAATSPGFSDTDMSPIPRVEHPAAMGDVLASTGASEPSVPVAASPQAKLAPPPPPPARHSSVRSGKGERPARPPSISSIDGVPASRRVRSDGASALPPPPPPTRRRGGSGTGKQVPGGGDKVKLGDAEAVPEEVQSSEGGGEGILADLDQLRREVEEMRSKFGKGS